MSATEVFVACFGGRAFYSFEEFEKELQKYMRANHVTFVRGTSSRSSNPILRYEKIFYRCVWYAKRKSISTGLRRVNSHDTRCPARFSITKKDNFLVVSSFEVEHNHPLNRHFFERHPVTRRLTDAELNECSTLFQLNIPSDNIKTYVAEMYGKNITTADISNIRRKLGFPQTDDL
ncbi:unnamed protein product [Dicrocoelium dendriticum]|nr:unnamed protein product [Dicrocoelium dendriticum]